MKKRSAVLSLLILASLFFAGLGTNTSSTMASQGAQGLVVDDFEDGNLTSKRGTQWYSINDQPMGGKSTAAGSIINIGAGGTRKAGRIAGNVTTDFKYGGFAGMGVHLNSGGSAQDMSGYTGLSFYARGDGGKFRVSVMTAAVKDHNEYGKEFTAPKAWTLVKIPFSQLAQVKGWGNPVPWTGKDIRGVEMTTVGAPRPNFFIEVDQIMFY